MAVLSYTLTCCHLCVLVCAERYLHILSSIFVNLLFGLVSLLFLCVSRVLHFHFLPFLFLSFPSALSTFPPTSRTSFPIPPLSSPLPHPFLSPLPHFPFPLSLPAPSFPLSHPITLPHHHSPSLFFPLLLPRFRPLPFLSSPVVPSPPLLTFPFSLSSLHFSFFSSSCLFRKGWAMHAAGLAVGRQCLDVLVSTFCVTRWCCHCYSFYCDESVQFLWAIMFDK